MIFLWGMLPGFIGWISEDAKLAQARPAPFIKTDDWKMEEHHAPR
jgi:hypothetical protein